MALIQFVRNYNVLSTDSGFQFESVWESEFEGTMTEVVTDLLDAAGSLFGC